MSEAMLANARQAELQIEKLKQALRESILDTGRISRRTVDIDSAGNVYEIDWLPRVKAWSDLCGLDLEKHDPCYYDR